jgi:hypothetical protein
MYPDSGSASNSTTRATSFGSPYRPTGIRATIFSIAAGGTAAVLAMLLPQLQPPTMQGSVAFEEHVDGVAASVGGRAGVVQEWYDEPMFYFTNPAVR